MGIFTSKQFNNLEDLFWDEVRDLYDAEHRIASELPKMAGAAEDPMLKQAFEEHLGQTKNQIKRLEQVFEHHGRKPDRVTCEGIKGLASEGSDIVSAHGSPQVKDAALIAAAQRVEHYEMAGYGSARTFAQYLGDSFSADLLQQTLDEEGATDHKLTDIAMRRVNTQAQRA